MSLYPATDLLATWRPVQVFRVFVKHVSHRDSEQDSSHVVLILAVINKNAFPTKLFVSRSFIDRLPLCVAIDVWKSLQVKQTFNPIRPRG